MRNARTSRVRERRRYGRAAVPAFLVLGDGLVVLGLAAWVIQGLATSSFGHSNLGALFIEIGATALGIALIHVAVAAGLWLGRPAARAAGVVVGLVWAVPGLASAPVTDSGARWISWLAVVLGIVTLIACVVPQPPPHEPG